MNKAINTLMQEKAYLALALGAVIIIIRFHLEKFNEATKLVRVRGDLNGRLLQARRWSPP
jgi:hypothetical protein